MSTLAALWNEEENWCESIRVMLAANAVGVPTANIQTAQSVTHSRSPRIEIEAEEVGEASPHLNRLLGVFPRVQDFAVGANDYAPANAQIGFAFAGTPNPGGALTFFLGNITTNGWYAGFRKADSGTWPVAIALGVVTAPGATLGSLATQGAAITWYYNEGFSSAVPQTGEFYSDHRYAMLRADLVTNRTAATAQDHGAMRGRIRYLMSRQAAMLVSPVVTWYVVADVQEMPSNVYVRDPEGDREDVTSFRWRLEYAILPSVVPTV